MAPEFNIIIDNVRRMPDVVRKKEDVEVDTLSEWVKASAHSFKRFTSQLLKVSFSISMHLLPRMKVMLDFI